MFGNLTGVSHPVSSAPSIGKSFGSLTRHEVKHQTVPFEAPKNEPDEDEFQSEEDLKALQKETRSWVEQ